MYTIHCIFLYIYIYIYCQFHIYCRFYTYIPVSMYIAACVWAFQTETSSYCRAVLHPLWDFSWITRITEIHLTIFEKYIFCKKKTSYSPPSFVRLFMNNQKHREIHVTIFVKYIFTETSSSPPTFVRLFMNNRPGTRHRGKLFSREEIESVQRTGKRT